MTEPTLHPAGTATWTSRRVSVELDDDFDTAVAKYEQAAPLYPPGLAGCPRSSTTGAQASLCRPAMSPPFPSG
jgi:hypothetical protein